MGAGRRVSQVQTGAEGLFGLEMDGNGQLWYVDGPGSQVGRVVVDVECAAAEEADAAADVATSSAVTWPVFECTAEVVVDTDEDRERFHHEAFLNTHNVSGAMSLDYSTMDASECDSVNFDVLLMEGFICHVCLPNPCANGGRCVHHDGIYTFGGFSCDCDGTGYEGDICSVPFAANYVAAELVLDLSLEAVSGNARQSFISNFREDIAALAQVEPSQVVVDSIQGGSVVVSFRILSAAPGSPSTSPSAALEFLQQSLVEAVRLDRVGVEVDSSVLVITAHVDAEGNLLPVETNSGQGENVKSIDQSGSTTLNSERGLVILIFCSLSAFVVAVMLAYLSYARRKQKQTVINSDLAKLQSIKVTPPCTPDLEWQAQRQAPQTSPVRGIVNARTNASGTREFKVRRRDGQDSWVGSEAVSANQIAQYENRKTKAQRQDWQMP